MKSNKQDPSSAENVALSLLLHFNDKRLPKADELNWLVSEQEVPQKVSGQSHNFTNIYIIIEKQRIFIFLAILQSFNHRSSN